MSDQKSVQLGGESRQSLCRWVVSSTGYLFADVIVSAYALCMDYIRRIFFTAEEDRHFDIGIYIVMGLLSLDLAMQLTHSRKYFLSFYFWLDLLILASLVSNLSIVWENAYKNDPDLLTSKNQSLIGLVIQLSNITFIFRFVRVYSRWRSWSQRQQSNKVALQTADVEEAERNAVEVSESKIAKQLAQRSIKKIVFVAFAMLYLLPFLDINNFKPMSVTLTEGVSRNVAVMLEDTSFSIQEINQYIHYVQHQMAGGDFPELVVFKTPFAQLVQVYNVTSQFRSSDIQFQRVQVDVQRISSLRGLTVRPNSTFITSGTNKSEYNRIQAAMYIGRIFFILMLILLVIHFSNKQIFNLVVKPIQKIIFKIRRISKNPHEAAYFQSRLADRPDSQNELQLIQSAILKTMSLLSLVFGYAGAQIIGKNIMLTGDFQFEAQGSKKVAIFGFCDIRNFTDITQCLQEEVMLFVNLLAQIIHTVVDQFGGAANKNVGDAFLLVWKLPDQYFYIEDDTPRIHQEHWEKVQQIADKALLAFSKILAELRYDERLANYQQNSKILARLGNDFRVQLGFGLHFGCGIEGAIGSDYKIDASYLGADVNMSSRLQAATKAYKIPILLSEQFASLLSPVCYSLCRPVDRVSASGVSQAAFTLYTVRLDLARLTPSDIAGKAQDSQICSLQFLNPAQSSSEELIFKAFPFSFIFKKETDFDLEYGLAFSAYLKGNWQQLRERLQTCLSLQKDDGPCLRMLHFLQQGVSEWRGYSKFD